MARALASHQCVPGSIPGPGVICGLSLLFSRGGGGGTPYNSLNEEAPPERGTLFRLQVYQRVGISQIEG